MSNGLQEMREPCSSRERHSSQGEHPCKGPEAEVCIARSRHSEVASMLASLSSVCLGQDEV